MALSSSVSTGWTMRKIVITVLSVVALLVMILGAGQAVVNVDAKQVVVVQSPISGDLTVHLDPGWKWQGWGKVTRYPRREQFSFSAHASQGNSIDESIQTRFNDGGHGNISGTINWAMPLSNDKIVALHKDFGSFEAVEQQLIRTSLQKVIYNVGPTMSSTESSAERRPDIPKFIDDQMANGPYLTKTMLVDQKDPITGQDKKVNIVTIVTGADGKPVRESHSQVTEYGLQLQPVSINNIKYDDVVEKQIKERQNATTQVQISIANARRAEQDAITTEQQGKASAAKAKWDQETVNAKEIALAEKDLLVAQKKALTAEQYKKQQILEGEGEASKKRLIMEADGGLDQKVEALKEINGKYADAIAKAQPGAWTPQIVMGNSSGGNQSGAQALVDLFTAKAAKDMGIDMRVSGAAATAKK